MSRFDTFAFGVVFGVAFALLYSGAKAVFGKHQCCCPGTGAPLEESNAGST